MSENETTTDILEGLIAKLMFLDYTDKDAVVEIGVGLEEVFDALAASPDKVTGLLGLILESVQALHADSSDDPDNVIKSVADGLASIRGWLTGEAVDGKGLSLEQAAIALNALCGGDVAAQEADAPVAQEPEPEAPEESPAEAAPVELSSILPDDTDEEILKEFVIECMDHMANAESALLDLESNPDDVEVVNTIFRAFHTIKGTSGFLGLEQIQAVAHLGENLLDRARDGELKITGGYADLALRSCDALKFMIEGLSGAKPGDEIDSPDDLTDLLAVLKDPAASGVTEDSDTEPMRVGEILVGKGQADLDDVEQAAETQGSQPIGKTLVEQGGAKATDVAKALRTQQAQGAVKKAAESTIRVGTDRLDSLINMVGELVIGHSMVSQDPVVIDGQHDRLTRNVAHAEKIIRQLQDLAMSLRMVPLKPTFQKMARLVRDLGRKAGKSVQYVTDGEETEIDRNMVEALNDPLVHMIRNAVDHGVEAADKRAADGKSPTGTVKLRASHSAGNVVIELTDDGKGLDRDKILAKAIEKGLVTADKTLSDSEIFSFIFQPGFSTADKITDVSGRGVGMDVVKRGIESLRGRIEIASTIGEGSTFTIRLPLTMAITDAMQLRVGTQMFLLPTVSIERSFRPEADVLSTVSGRGELIMHRGDLLPIFRLHELFSIPGAVTEPTEGLLIIVENEGKRFALMADEILGQQQCVVKSLGEYMGHIPGVAGGTILGDGRVGLIIDASGLMQFAIERTTEIAA